MLERLDAWAQARDLRRDLGLVAFSSVATAYLYYLIAVIGPRFFLVLAAGLAVAAAGVLRLASSSSLVSERRADSYDASRLPRVTGHTMGYAL